MRREERIWSGGSPRYKAGTETTEDSSDEFSAENCPFRQKNRYPKLQKKMITLAIETSCDDTAVALVEDGCRVVAELKASQVVHQEWGGVVPELAAREHTTELPKVLAALVDQFSAGWEGIDQISVTYGPGLQPSLLTGTQTASFLSLATEKPLYAVHHLRGHFYANVLGRSWEDLRFPSLVLTASGGHTQLDYWTAHDQITPLGATRDDAVGEAFDKVAKLLGLPYPGGPAVSEQAKKGSPSDLKLPIPQLGKGSLDFSFSGLKAAVWRVVDQASEAEKLDPAWVANICYQFEQTTAQILRGKLQTALEQYPQTQQVHFVGGVAANQVLREAMAPVVGERDFLFPQQLIHCTDNAAMIGAAAYADITWRGAQPVPLVTAQGRIPWPV